MKVKYSFFVFTLCILVWTCSPKTVSVSKEDGKIISYIIDESSFPLIPPPPIDYDTTSVIPQKLIDSMNNVELKIWIHPEMDTLSREYLSRQVPIKVLSKFKKQYSDTRIIIKKLDNINSSKGHTLALADTLLLKEAIDFTGADQLFNFSRIIYNKKQDAALIDIGISHSGLAGSSRICYLQKKNGQWRIISCHEGYIW